MLHKLKITDKKNQILLSVFIISLVFISILSFSQYYLDNKIISSEQKYYNQQLSNLLKSIDYNNNVLDSKIILTSNKYLKLLGKAKPADIYIAKYNNIPKAIIVNTTAPDGYNGNIDLLVAIKLKNNKASNTNNANINKIINIKILQHQETPGLGDLIEPEKSNWLAQFINKYLNNSFWGLKKDNKTIKTINNLNNNSGDNIENSFDSITGATITSRAVTKAIYNSLLLVDKYPEIINKNKSN